jgi:CHAT domain-containing protein/Tfp pilus assembly protein PilF
MKFQKITYLPNKFILYLLLIITIMVNHPAVKSQQATNDKLESIVRSLIEAKSKEEQNQILEKNNQQVTAELLEEMFNQAYKMNNEAKYELALSTCDLIISLAEGGKVEELKGKAIRLKARIMYIRGRYNEAIEYSQDSLRIGEKINNKELIGDSLNTIGNVYNDQGDYYEALKYYFKTLEIIEELGNKKKIASVMNNIGNAYYRQGNYNQSLQYHLKSLKLREEINDKYSIAVSFNNIGNIYSSQGNYTQALEYYLRSLELYEQVNNKYEISNPVTNMGIIHTHHGNFSQALDYLHRALKITEETGNKQGMAMVLNTIGAIHYHQGNYSKALDHHFNSLKISEEINDKDEISNACVEIGLVYKSQGKYTEAMEYFHRSLKIREENGDKQGIAITLNNIGEIYASQGDHSSALDYLSRASGLASQTNSLDALWYILLTSGSSHMALGNLDLARKDYLDSINTIEQLRLLTSGPASDQQLFFQNRVAPYYALVSVLINSKDYHKAFLFAERAKARVLLDQLQNSKLDLTTHMSNKEIQQDRILTSELITLNTKLSMESQKTKSNQVLVAELKAKREKARLEYEAFQSKLYIAHPAIRLQRGTIQPISFDETSSLIDNKSAIMEYVVTKDSTYLFLLTQPTEEKGKSQLDVFTIKISSKELDKKISDFHRKVSTRDLAVRRPAQDLYNLLIKPAENKLKGITKLCIVPDGSLWDLPFQALDRNGNNWMIEDFSISYAPSLSALREMRKKKSTLSTEGAELLAFGNPKISAITSQKVRSLYRDEKFAPLPHAEKEVVTLGKLYGKAKSKIMIGAEAREEIAKTEAGKYRIIHFATHGILDDNSPMYSRLMLTSEDGSKEDGMLEAWEIMRMNLNADLVVMAACETARGKVSAGEGVIGMSWATFVAGVPATVVSQWKVDSEATSEMMIEFHKQIRKKKSKAEALREASIKIMKSGLDHPYYWAGFIIVGDER